MKKLNEGSKYWLQLFRQMCSQASIDEWDGIDFYDIAKAAQNGDKSAKEAIFWQMRNIIEATYAKNKKSVYLWSNQLGLFEKNPEGPSQVNEMALNWISTSWTVIFDGYPISDGETVGPLIKHVQPTKGLDYLSWIYSKKILNLLYKEYYLNSSTGLSKNKGIDSISANLYADKRQDNGGEHSIKREIIDDWQSETNLPEEDLAVSDALRSFRKFTRDPELNEKKHGFSPMIAFRTVIMNMAKGTDAEKNVANLAAKYNVSRNTFASYAKEAATTLVNKYDVSLDELQQLIKVYGSGALGRLIKESSYKPKPLARINENYDFRLLESIFNGKVLLSESNESIYDVYDDYEKDQLKKKEDDNIETGVFVVTDFSDDSYKNPKVKRIKIADGVTSIKEDAFFNCKNLTEVIIPDSVTTIGDFAFANCEELKTIKIPKNVTSIGRGAFCGCIYMTSIIIPDSVTTIEDSTFSNCMRLETIKIPNSVTSIGEGAFLNCARLASIIIPDSVTSIGKLAFADCNRFKTIKIPNSVTSIGDRAFYNCYNLESIKMPESATSIGFETFRSCNSLKSINIPKGVTAIEYSTFFMCEDLTSIIIPDSVTSIENDAFENCKNLKTIHYAGTRDQWNAIEKAFDWIPSTRELMIDYNYQESSTFDEGSVKLTTVEENKKKYWNNFFDSILKESSVSLKEHENPYAPRAATICKSLTKDIDFDNDDNAWDKAADILVEFIDSMIEQSMDYFPVDEYEPELYKIWEEHEKRHE